MAYNDQMRMDGLADYIARRIHRGQMSPDEIEQLARPEGLRPLGFKAVIRYWPDNEEVETASLRHQGRVTETPRGRTTIADAMSRDAFYDRRAKAREMIPAGRAAARGNVIPFPQQPQQREQGLER